MWRRLDVFRVTVRLSDELGFWDGPVEGDLAACITWRGLASNEVKLGYGKTGGGIKDSANATPVPPDRAQLVIDTQRACVSARSAAAASGGKWEGDKRRFEEQATFGPSPQLDAAIKRIGDFGVDRSAVQ